MSDAPPIVIRIGAALESSINRSFDTVEARATRAATTTARVTAKGGSDSTAALDREWKKQLAALNKVAGAQDKLYERNAKNAATQAAKAAKDQERSQDRSAKAAERAAAREAAAAERSAKAREKAANQAANASLRGFAQIARAARAAEVAEAKQGIASNRRLGERFARGTANTATRFLTPYAPLASIARRTASDLIRGLGVDLNVSSAVSRNVERESLATSLSNSGFQEKGTGPNTKRVNPAELLAQAKDVGNKTGFDPTSIIEGSRAFVGITGNLEQARQMMFDLSKISKATTSDVTDVSTAAAKINAQMADTPTKAEDTLAVVRLLAGQGKLGAAEMADFAKSIGKIAGTAHRFKGDVSNNIAELSAMAQLSVQRGFAANPTQAATGVSSFANTFSKAARVKAFQAAHIDVANLSPEQIIKQALVHTKGDNLAMGKLFADVRGRSVVLPFEQAFTNARGGNTDSASIRAGLDAVTAEFDRLKKGAMSTTEVDKEFASQMGTTKSRVQQFQNKLDDVVERVQSKLLPSLEKLGPAFLELADMLGKATTWIVDNPKQAIATAIGMSIGRAGLEQTLRTGIERILLGQNGASAAGVGSLMGSIGASIAIASLVVATLTVGTAIIDHFGKKDEENQRAGAEGLAHAEEQNSRAEALLKAGDVEGAKKAAEAAGQHEGSGLAGVGDPKDNSRTMNLIRIAAASMGLGGIEVLFDKKISAAVQSREGAEAATREQLISEQRRTNALLQQVAANTAKRPAELSPGGPPGRVTQLGGP